MIRNRPIQMSAFLLALAAAWLLTAMTASWWSYQHQLAQQQQQLHHLSDNLIPHLLAEPTFAGELLTFARANGSLPLRSAILFGRDGKPLVHVGDSIPLPAWQTKTDFVADGVRYWRQPVGQHQSLLLAVDQVPISGFWFYLTLPMLLGGALWHWWQRRQQARLFAQLWQLIPEVLQVQGSEGSELRQFGQAVSQLVQQRDEAAHQASLNLQLLHNQQKQHVEQRNEIRLLLTQAENCNLHQNRALQCWQNLVRRSPQLVDAELRHWATLLGWCQRQETDNELQQQSITQWFAATVGELVPMWPEDILLLPDEDPDTLRYLAEFDGRAMRHLVQSLCLAVKPFIDGKELLIRYRLQPPQRDKLQLQLQYTGKSLSARSRQILQQGGMAEPQWDDVPFEISRHLLQLLRAELHITELADLGSRLELSFPLQGQLQPQSRRFQNLLVCDPRPCRLDLWRQSLLGVSEQVLATGSLDELKVALQSRLVDVVVVHWFSEQMSDAEVLTLQQLSQRYQLVLFAPLVIQRRCGEQMAGHKYVPPLLLAPLSALPQPGAQFASQQLLIVDDNPTNLSFVRAMLAGQDISIDFATTGLEALKLANHSRYQLILMDIQLPDLSGVEVTKRIRQLRHHQHTVILAFTGHALPEEAASFRLAGMDDVMIKPLDARKIAHILSRIRPLAEIQ